MQAGKLVSEGNDYKPARCRRMPPRQQRIAARQRLLVLRVKLFGFQKHCLGICFKHFLRFVVAEAIAAESHVDRAIRLYFLAQRQTGSAHMAEFAFSGKSNAGEAGQQQSDQYTFHKTSESS
jgi:hypothetical protein